MSEELEKRRTELYAARNKILHSIWWFLPWNRKKLSVIDDELDQVLHEIDRPFREKRRDELAEMLEEMQASGKRIEGLILRLKQQKAIDELYGKQPEENESNEPNRLQDRMFEDRINN